MLAEAEIADVEIQKQLIRRAQQVWAMVVAVILAILVPAFFGLGLLIGGIHGSDDFCGRIGHLKAPECDSLSWEFCLAIVALGFVFFILLMFSSLVCCAYPRAARRRRRLRDERVLRDDDGP